MMNDSISSRFAVIGIAGFVAPRHLRAIKEVGGTVLSAMDPNDSVGVIDSYFPDARFFVEFERFDRHIDKLKRAGTPAEYISICSPNYLHDAHVRFALRSGATAICEKPLVLNPWNLDGLAEMERETGAKVNTILQLRLHPAIRELKSDLDATPRQSKVDVDLSYVTSRGAWYQASWKGEVAKSGGVATNIGVHFFDMLGHLFGDLQTSDIHLHDPLRAAGYLEFEKARVRWFLSVDRMDLPPHTPEGQTTFRSITLDGKEIEFSKGFTDLHTESYKQILSGNGFPIETVRPSIELVSSIRDQTHLVSDKDTVHPLARPHIT